MSDIPPTLRPLLHRMEKFRTEFTSGNDAHRQALKLDGLRAGTYHGTPFSAPRAELGADVGLLQHLERLPRALDATLFHPAHEDRLATWFLQTLRGEPYDALVNLLNAEEAVPTAGSRVGRENYVFRALCALIQHYMRPHAAVELYARMAAFEWGASVADARMRSDELWRQATATAQSTADFEELDRFSQPTWGYWLRDFLRPKFPLWVEALAKTRAAQFTSAAIMWPFLQQHEPEQIVSSLMAFGPCWRCGQPGHVLAQCRAARSDAENNNQHRSQWPLMAPHPSQDRQSAALPPPPDRPAGAPVPFVRPGYGGATGGETFVSSIQAMPPAPSSDATALALFGHQLASLQAVQDSQTQVLQDLSTLLVAHMPTSVAVPTVPAPLRPTSSSLHQLATLPPACFGTTSPGSCYVSVPAHSTVWLRTDVAEDSMDMHEAAAASPPPPAKRSGSERM
jgi:hypothetical protein